MYGTATYSPEDNKLRLYPDGRLPQDIYERVKAAGFAWAPKQELFVAGMWTPGRFDLLVELCGEVGDEDTSLVERAEERSERFEGYSERRAADGDAAESQANLLSRRFEGGQPILVGHHSERGARKAAEKIENNLHKALKMWETSAYWRDRAAGAIAHAKYKELPDVRARRIKKLESELRKTERDLAEAKKRYAAWQSVANMDGADEIIPDDGQNMNAAQRLAYTLANYGGSGWNAYHPTCEEVNAKAREIWGHGFSAYDFLTKTEFVGLPFPKLTPRQVATLYVETFRNPNDGDSSSVHRWIEHYQNRLAYERAMLAESGGTVADKTKPEVGGACRCWASPGYGKGWSYISKVNKVSVSVGDSFGGTQGARVFRRLMPFDKLAAVMSKAEVDQARAEGRLHEVEDGTGFYLTEVEAVVPKPTPPPADENLAKIEEMKARVKEGVQVLSAPTLYPTPPEIAREMVELAQIEPTHRVLEPSAGTGALLWEIGAEPVKVAVEYIDRLAEALAQCGMPNLTVHCADFLSLNGELGTFDRVVMNPPFNGGADIKHVLHAIEHLKPGGRLVALCANGPRQQDKLRPMAEEWRELPEGSFKMAGTNVRVALMTYEKEDA